MAGIPIGLNLSVAVILVLVIAVVVTQTLPAAVHRYPQGASWAVVLLVGLLCSASLLTQELAHALVTGRYGVRVEKITLRMLGGVAQLASEPPRTTAGPDDALADVLDRAGRRLPALLMEHGNLVGMVTDIRTNRLLRRAALSAGPQ